jgi:hypothetical protein
MRKLIDSETLHILRHIRLTLTMLLWKRNQLFGRPLLVVDIQARTCTRCVNIWAASASIVILLKTPTMQFYLGRWPP